MTMKRALVGLLAITLSGCSGISGDNSGEPRSSGGQSGSEGSCTSGVDCWCGKAARLGPARIGVVTEIMAPPSSQPIAVGEVQLGPRSVIRVALDGGTELTGFADQCGGGIEDLDKGDRTLVFFDPGDCAASATCIDNCPIPDAFDCVAGCLRDHRESCALHEPTFELAALRAGQWALTGVQAIDEAAATVLNDEQTCRSQLKNKPCNDTAVEPPN